RALHVAGEKVFVLSTVQGMQHFLRPPPPGQAHPLADVLKDVPQHDRILAYNFSKLIPATDAKKGAPQMYRTAFLAVDESRDLAQPGAVAVLRMAFPPGKSGQDRAEEVTQTQDGKAKADTDKLAENGYRSQVVGETVVFEYHTTTTDVTRLQS